MFNGTDINTTMHSFVFEMMTIVAHTDQHMRYNRDITVGKKNVIAIRFRLNNEYSWDLHCLP